MIKRILGVLMVILGGFLGVAGVAGLLKVNGDPGSTARDFTSAVMSAMLMGGLCVFLVRIGMKWIKDLQGIRKPDRVLKGTGIVLVVVGGLAGLGCLGGLWGNLVRFKNDPQFVDIFLGLLFFVGCFEVLCVFLIRVGLKWIKQS